MKISVCIPMYNESRIIENTARTLSKYLGDHFGENEFEIIFSDDGSLDKSADIVRALALPGVRVIGYDNNKGKGCAVRAAMLEAKGDIVMFTDADLAYGEQVIERGVAMLEANSSAEMLIGSRNMSRDGYEEYSLLRKAASKAYIKVLSIVGGFKLSDSQCGFKMFRREAAQRIFSRCEVDSFAFDFEVILWAEKLGMSIVEMPVKVLNKGDSKVRMIRDAARMLSDLLKIKKRVKKSKI